MKAAEFKKLGDFVKIKTGKLDANASSNDGEYPFFTCSIEPLKISSFSYDCECCLVAGNGDLNVKYYNGKFDAYQRTYIIESLDKEKLDVMYLYFFLCSYIEVLRKQSIGGVIKYIKLGNLTDALIPIPSLENQKEICRNLIQARKVLNESQALLSKYDILIKSRFIEMFGDPVQNPMGWEVKKLGKMCSAIMNGTTPKGGEQVYVEKGITFLRSQNVWRNKIDLDDVAYIDEATHKSMKKSSLKKYDILMTKTGRINTENSSLGRAALFLGEDDSANINGHVYLIRLEKEYNHEFVIRILTSSEYRDYIRSICVGGIDKRQVNKDHIEEFPIIQPPKELQDEYSTFVQQIDKSKFENNYKELVA